MKQLSRRAAIRILATGGGLLGLGLAGGYALRDLLRSAHGPAPAGSDPASPGMQAPMMGNATAADMSTYMDLFSRHTELHRTVEPIPVVSVPSPSPMTPIWPPNSKRTWRACTRI
jgi:hypothetical protein